jgi:hypothetical protein
MPRHDRKAYETLTSRMPQGLVDLARQYARQHGTTVGTLLREGLLLRLQAGTRPAKVRPSHAQKVRPSPTEKVRPSPTRETLHPVDGPEEVRPFPTEEVRPFDPARFTLGTLCHQGHAYGTTGRTLRRRANGNCVACNAAQQRARRAAKQAAPTPA